MWPLSLCSLTVFQNNWETLQQFNHAWAAARVVTKTTKKCQQQKNIDIPFYPIEVACECVQLTDELEEFKKPHSWK